MIQFYNKISIPHLAPRVNGDLREADEACRIEPKRRCWPCSRFPMPRAGSVPVPAAWIGPEGNGAFAASRRRCAWPAPRPIFGKNRPFPAPLDRERSFSPAAAIQQAIDYADDLNADYIFVTNGDYAMTAKYEADSNQYVLLSELPDYQSMLCGQGDYLPEDKPKERFAFDVLNENKDYYRGYEFNPDTPSELLPFLTNLWECFLDTSHKMPEKQYKHFRLIKDYGIRFLSCGNAAGGSYQGAYRSFLIEYQADTKFMNLGFFDYGSHTILTVSVDKDNNKPHNSLQYDVNAIIRNGERYSFPHHGRIAIGKKGSGKVSELKELIGNEAPELLVRGDIFLGTLHNQKLLYLDDADVTDFVEKMLTYALIRDVFREMKSGN